VANKSSNKIANKPGTLYLVATPIGNLEDITFRAVRILGEVDFVAAEDTRQGRKLLSHLGISKPVFSYFAHNERKRGRTIIERLAAGETAALISDAGTPGLSDPGEDLVGLAIAAGIQVIALPGASALLPALTVSGISAKSFVFEGFLPRRQGERQKYLRHLATEPRTLVFYEAPHRLAVVLKDLMEIFGNNRSAVVCRELTKYYEEIKRGSLEALSAYFTDNQPKGEFTLVIAGAQAQEPEAKPNKSELADAMLDLLEQGLGRKEAARQIAERFGLSAQEVYRLGIK
jgi:16S rRNA (cytidine1402-2'-O)-methyltransferase